MGFVVRMPPILQKDEYKRPCQEELLVPRCSDGNRAYEWHCKRNILKEKS
jgi:hypothetical protein